MTPQPNIPPRPACAICGKRDAQAVIGGKDGTTTIRIPTCGECFIDQQHEEIRLWRRSLALVQDGWPR